ncbi:MAG: NAD-dependent epimerase [Methylotenera sp.]|uniref:NAD-dependent epimerase n=1 Tax=Methylotenera sp. TaxID=2051956 RepID=UPI00271BAAB4|nr:NAD-dependent epimerase [Methylotenera sp.]MDO9150686.1 NAD-dependent epimerase [Methylotenera sp.]
MKKILITGSAGFIGFHLAKALLQLGHQVIGVDNLNDYYDPKLKYDRLKELDKFAKALECADRYTFVKLDLSNKVAVESIFENYTFDVVIHLAAQAGVRYSIDNPHAYINSNVLGFLNVIEGCRHSKVSHFLYASSSSVYGNNSKQPFSESDNVDHPVSLYAATKKSNELIAHTYSHLFNLPTSGLRFFTVYGPWGRPDMAYYKFTKSILENKAIDIYNHGNLERDFTYIDDIINGIISIVHQSIESANENFHIHKEPGVTAPYRIYNLGCGNPVSLNRFIEAIEVACGMQAIKNILPMQPGDVASTYADISKLKEIGFTPQVQIEYGISQFVDWYKSYVLA